MLETTTPPPWSGGGGRYAIPDVLNQVTRHRTTLIFHNTRAQAELFFHDLWLQNTDDLPIGIHHGSLSREQRERVEQAMTAGALRAVVCTGSLDLGIDWGDVDLVIQVGAPKERQTPCAKDRPRQPPLQRALQGPPRPSQPVRGGRMSGRPRRRPRPYP